MLGRGLIYEAGTAEVDEKCVFEFQPHARDKSRSLGMGDNNYLGLPQF